MEALDLARWQFGITTVYHFIFVPLTIGLAPLVAIMQTIWHRTHKERWLKLTKFFGKLFLINFALGVVTGIVQEFQFGMNWSEYSRFVGDIFGAPLAMEALAAFFVESTFLGLWIFGWDKLSKRVHLLTIWLVAFAVNLSAFFILAANSFMQHPVGATYNEATGRAEMNDFAALVTNPVVWVTFPHTIASAFLVAGTFVAGIAGWWIVKAVRAKNEHLAKDIYKPAVKLGVTVMLIAGVAVLLTGDMQAKEMVKVQPMKMAAAEALCNTTDNAPFSILSIGNFSQNCDDVNRVIEVPGLTSFLATGSFSGDGSTVQGVKDMQAKEEAQYGATDANGNPIDYAPNLLITYWSFRFMIGLGVGAVLLALGALWYLRKGRVTDSKVFKWVSLIAIPTPFLACSFGWIFTEMGRQPWIVAPNPTGVDSVRLLTEQGVSAGVAPWTVIISMVAFTLVYLILAVFWFILMKKYASQGVPELPAESDASDDAGEKPLSFAY